MWTRSFRARRPKKCALKMLKQSLWKRSFRARLLSKTLRFLCCETSLLWNFFAVRLLCCEISLLWDFFAARLLCCEASLLWGFFAVRLLCCVTSFLWDFNHFQRSVTGKLDIQTSFEDMIWTDVTWFDMTWWIMMEWRLAELKRKNGQIMRRTWQWQWPRDGDRDSQTRENHVAPAFQKPSLGQLPQLAAIVLRSSCGNLRSSTEPQRILFAKCQKSETYRSSCGRIDFAFGSNHQACATLMPPFTLLERYASLICFKFQGASSCLQDLVLSEFFQFESCFWANFFDHRCLFHVFLAVARSKHHFARCRAGHCKGESLSGEGRPRNPYGASQPSRFSNFFQYVSLKLFCPPPPLQRFQDQPGHSKNPHKSTYHSSTVWKNALVLSISSLAWFLLNLVVYKGVLAHIKFVIILQTKVDFSLLQTPNTSLLVVFLPGRTLQFGMHGHFIFCSPNVKITMRRPQADSAGAQPHMRLRPLRLNAHLNSGPETSSVFIWQNPHVSHQPSKLSEAWYRTLRRDVGCGDYASAFSCLFRQADSASVLVVAILPILPILPLPIRAIFVVSPAPALLCVQGMQNQG